MELLEGSAAIAESAIVAGCRFFAGYPMSPFTGLLENMSQRMPAAGGVCLNAESEIEGVNMTLGAAAAGARAATGSCGQGIALMQEAIAEAALNQTPFVVFNMARNQQDYFQCTRGGGWGDYRTITLAPKDVPEAVELTQLAFDLADRHRAPVIFYGDPFIAQTRVGVTIERRDYGPLPAKSWALDGTGGGTGRSRQVWTWAMGKANDPGPGPDKHWRAVAAKFDAIDAIEARHEQAYVEDADTLVVSFGSAAKFVEHVVAELRQDGHRIGWFRPITLWPFPGAALEEATRSAKRVLVFEVNAGQMIDDVRLNAVDRKLVRAIGGVSIHESGLAYGELMDAPVIRDRVLEVINNDR
jgi:2-oxoglutarate/2-oxoacid ferredoxin oxidoreductase subunit alpha